MKTDLAKKQTDISVMPFITILGPDRNRHLLFVLSNKRAKASRILYPAGITRYTKDTV